MANLSRTILWRDQKEIRAKNFSGKRTVPDKIWRAWRDLNSRHSEPESDFIPFMLLDVFILSFVFMDSFVFYFVLNSLILFSCCNKIATENWSKE